MNSDNEAAYAEALAELGAGELYCWDCTTPITTADLRNNNRLAVCSAVAR